MTLVVVDQIARRQGVSNSHDIEGRQRFSVVCRGRIRHEGADKRCVGRTNERVCVAPARLLLLIQNVNEYSSRRKLAASQKIRMLRRQASTRMLRLPSAIASSNLARMFRTLMPSCRSWFWAQPWAAVRASSSVW